MINKENWWFWLAILIFVLIVLFANSSYVYNLTRSHRITVNRDAAIKANKSAGVPPGTTFCYATQTMSFGGTTAYNCEKLK